MSDPEIQPEEELPDQDLQPDNLPAPQGGGKRTDTAGAARKDDPAPENMDPDEDEAEGLAAGGTPVTAEDIRKAGVSASKKKADPSEKMTKAETQQEAESVAKEIEQQAQEEEEIPYEFPSVDLLAKPTGKDNDVEDEIDTKTDLVTINYFPISISHCNITLCYEQDLPQVLSNELIVQFMNIFQIENNKTLICGYDSLGGGCVINQLHFEFLMLDDFANEINALPIELREAKPIFETKLKYKNEKEISMFDGTTNIKVSVILEPFVCWKIEAKTNKAENSDISAMENLFQNSISHIVNLILTKLIDKEIPHNIIMTNQGKCFYLIPRKFEDRKQRFNSCWNDLAGLITCKEEKTYNDITEEDINKFYKDEISMDKNEFDKINEDILNQIDSVFEITKF
jgi:hypothetical protein